MKILFFGDSITDARRNREEEIQDDKFGYGFVNRIVGELCSNELKKYQIYNRGISGNRVVDLYARVKCDCWNLEPDVISILIGINDIWHEISRQNGVDIVRFEKVYDMLLADTKKQLPNTKIILCEPFVLMGLATKDAYDSFCEVKKYAKLVKKLADKYGAEFLPLQEQFEISATKLGEDALLVDGVHPSLVGAKLIADQWLKLFFEKIDKD